jgi:APA family basic amino acid/polyamine antiporter
MDDAAAHAPLRRTLGWPSLTAYGVGAILGAGIYSVIGAAAGRVGAGMWIAFAIAAIVALITALSYAELATMFPRAGAEFVYVRRALPHHGAFAFTAGTMMAAAAAATVATVSIAFNGYLSSFLDAPSVVVAPLLVVFLASVAIVGIRESTWMVAVFTCIEAAGLVVVVVLGATSERFGAAVLAAPTSHLLSGAALVFFSYLGFENIVNLAEETKDPERNLPRAILLSLGFSTALYILVAIAAVALLPAAELARSDAPLADAVRGRSPSLAGALGGVALFATANTAMAAIMSGSRILYAMADAGELPGVLSSVLKRRRTPWLATIAIAMLALALLPLGSVAVVASISSFACLLAFAVVNASVIILRLREPRRARPFRVPLSLGRLPILPLLGALSALLLASQLDRVSIACGAGLIVVSLGGYALMRRHRPR